MDITLQSLIGDVLATFINPLFPILVGFALILFMWGLVKYLKGGLGDKKDLDGAKSLMLWGVIVLFVMVSVWGFVKILQQTFFGDDPPITPPNIPQFNGNSNPNADWDPDGDGLL
ncbi:MAG: hypothetical protein COV08_03290 [Candidatus Vogelbacteria bacterium CG10_big_fil_rev_8_21_14_0_10_49_38]|uniref:Uncharacterized protein n=1 Tax=Candidatus Vogelbacteria bacterium CG10_big_fil_rev_8_21_14_0_10_49_38 TaxID=1975043 RepID=A0A2H0RGU9_9BACT|nr:MAG: hypothetical protein BK006_03290 [bacterium CG10_49_38]PIR45769.1 MAG: hypothetical protein COV08_03290 [Candidatus Vogelbacteria bacterium CG10_big_fil_rev_8_21_14_0_10_49_38]